MQCDETKINTSLIVCDESCLSYHKSYRPEKVHVQCVCWICTEPCRKDEVWMIDSSIVGHNIYVSFHNIRVHSCLTALSLFLSLLVYSRT